MAEPPTMKCAEHPDTETTLKCSKCGKPICPRCMVQTPVGARCRDCARLSVPPTYRVNAVFYLRAIGAALAAAVIIGLIWGFVSNYLPYIFLNLLLAAGFGYAIGEVTGLAVNRKRGVWLAVIGVAAVAVSYVVRIFSFGEIPSAGMDLAIDIIGLFLGIYLAVNRLY